jgi:hypothetical protein
MCRYLRNTTIIIHFNMPPLLLWDPRDAVLSGEAPEGRS